MYSKRLLILLCLAAAFVTPGLRAHTVMVYVTSESEHDDYLLSAVEAGVMDEFFEAGHIVFNAGTYERVSDSDMQRRYWVRNTARRGGATHAVEVEVSLRPLQNDRANSGDALFADSAGFRFTRLEPAELLRRGRIEVTRLPPRGDRDNAAFRLGIEVARSALDP